MTKLRIHPHSADIAVRVVVDVDSTRSQSSLRFDLGSQKKAFLTECSRLHALLRKGKICVFDVSGGYDTSDGDPLKMPV